MVIAKRIKGIYTKRKAYLSFVLMLMFLVTPLISFGGRPILFLDIDGRVFHVFGLVLWPQDLYALNLLLVLTGVLLFFVTTWRGRIFCAYACPQSVLTELYDWIGRTLGGDKYGKRSQGKLSKFVVHTAWVFTSVFLSYWFLRYFVKPEVLHTGEIFYSTALYFWCGLTIFAYVIWGRAREVVCNQLCPYGRFQTSMMDSETLIVKYDTGRGEPRRQKGQKEYAGDCTACNMCVVTCPTGIDIREGLQVGCIRCGICVDACTKEMSKKGKASLINVDSFGDEKRRRYWQRPRLWVYSVVMVLSISLAAMTLAGRDTIYKSVILNHNLGPYKLGGTLFQNGYKIHLANKNLTATEIEVSIEGVGFEIASGKTIYALKSGQHTNFNILVRYKGTTTGAKEFDFIFKDSASQKTYKSKSKFQFPSGALL